MTAKKDWRKTYRGKAFSWLMVLCMVLTMFIPQFAAVSYADAGDEPDHEKTIAPNLTEDGKEDGTYKLELSVTGDADNTTQEAGGVNVVVVYDVSQSMTNSAGNSWNSRADEAENVVHDFLTDLTTYQNAAKDNIKVSLVTFAVNSTQVQGWTTNVAGVADRFDDGTGEQRNPYKFTYNGLGTNWESGLQRAQTLVGNTGNSNPTFVILITDGAPTASGNGNNAIAPTGATIAQLRDRYNAATNEAAAIADAVGPKGTFYGIYAYGTEADLLDDLMYYSVNGQHRGGSINNVVAATQDAPNYFNAGETEELQAAIDEIFEKVVQAMGISSVEIKDGTTHEVETSSGDISLLEVDEDSYQYWLTVPIVNNQFTRTKLTGENAGETITYTVADNGDGTYTITWNDGGTKSVTVKGEKTNTQLKYEWTEANELYNQKPPEAHLNGSSVDWSLTSVGTLLDGVTYSVTFDVYPTQTTLDYIADSDNGLYNTIPAEVREYLSEDGKLETNTTATLSYADTRNNTTGSATYDNPEPVESSAVEQLAVSKEWTNSIDGQQWAPIDLEVMRDGTHKYDLTLSSGNNWQGSVYISIGIMRTNPRTGQMETLAKGHDFTFEEPENIGYQWELDVPTVRPMLIEGVMTMLIKVDEAHPAPSGAATYTIDGAEYYEGSTGTASLTAKNYRRSQLVLTKAVTGDDAPADTKFPFTMVVNNRRAATGTAGDLDSDKYVWFLITDASGETVMEEGYVTSGATAEEGSNGFTGYYYAESGATISASIPKDYSIRFINLPSDSDYTFTEGALAAGFTFQKAELTGGTDEEKDEDFAVEDKTATGKVAEWNTEYTVTFTNRYEMTSVTVEKVWADGNDQDGLRPKTLDLTLKGLPEGTTAPDPTIAKDGNTWTYTWTGLPKYDSTGAEITYKVAEESVPADYTVTLESAKTDGVANGGTITNTHTPETIDIPVEKVWVGPAGDAVTVTLYADGNATDKTVTLNANKQWKDEFKDLPVKKAGTKIEYTVVEAGVSGVDASKYKTTIEGDAENGFTITNTNTEKVNVTVTKKWDDSNDIGGIRPDALDLTLKGLPAGTTAPDPTVTKNGSTWTYTWKDLPKYDTSTNAEITYKVAEESVPGGYTVSPESAKTDGVASGGTITNKYTPETTTAEIKAGKKLDVPAGLDGTDVSGKYDLVLEAAEGVPMPEGAAAADGKQTVTIKNADGDGTMTTFGEITYAVPGKYQYAVSEKGTVAGVTNGTASYTVMVEVKDDGTGKLEATVKTDGKETNEVLFTNTYAAEPAEAVIGVTKVLEGTTLSGGAFSFTLTPGEGAPGEAQTKTNDADGKVAFDAITFDKVGTYTYTVKETAGDKDYIEYDSHSVTATVTVSDDGEGKLVADVSYEGDTVFTNTYTADGQVDLSVKKSFNKELKGEDFTFRLLDEDGEELQSKTNAADGSVTFDPIEYTTEDLKETTTEEVTVSYKEVTEGDVTTYVNVEDETDVLETLPEGAVLNEETGNYDVTAEVEKTSYKDEATFKYSIKEVAGQESAVKYDSHTVNVTVTVKNNGDGTLTATPSYEGSTTFVNTYSASGSLDLGGTKTLKGADLKKGQFSFQLLDKNNKVLSTVSNDAEGNFTFGTLKFDEKSIDKTYKFYIAEVNDNQTGVTYDTHKCEVTVQVFDNEDGTLGFETAYADGDMAVFENTFEPLPVLSDPPVKKIVKGDPPTDATFTFQMKAVTEGAPMPAGSKDGVKTVQITGNGSYEFGNMYYDEPGEWVYEISEIDDGVKGYTYDTTKYTLTVKVTEDADGDGYLDKTETVTGGDGQIVFTNVYKAEPAPSPKTGDGTATTVALLTLLASAALIGLFGQRRKEQR